MASVVVEQEALDEHPNQMHPAHEIGLKMLLAGCANATSAMVTNPADLVKVRQQLFVKAGSGRSPGFVHTLIDMVRKEGFFSIYNGVSASMIRELSYSGIRMGCYDQFKSGILSLSPSLDPHSVIVKLGAGLGSGCLGAAIANPADVLKVRRQAVGGAALSLRGHARAVYAEQGFKGFYRAVVPTVIRAGVLTSSQLGSYDVAKHFLRTHYPTTFPEGLFTHLVCSGFAGFACSVTSAPIDTVKVRMMNDATKQYSSSLECAAKMLRYEGPMAFYKGFIGCWTRLWPHTVISLVIFEKLRAFAGLNPI
ncbi:Mitochondrial substrate carrier family protein ucpB [Vanrija pseudolonga]|uniref:Mitochondrial substrate carrier family protein ucpB n=1 Tax=Vanrija pseudolonga TaxID=143232 RepID=A0AAF0YD38_9TREE|nr:Mitochondrial substrate carrier family protein ucpB [Vanrija pseudolonga]